MATLQDSEPTIEQLLDALPTSPPADPDVQNSSTNGNGSPGNGKAKVNASIREIQQVVAALTGLKSDLRKVGLLDKPEFLNKVLQIEAFIASGAKKFEASLLSNAQQQFQDQRQHIWAITQQMQQTTDLQTLARLTVTAVQTYLQTDRVLVYRCHSQDGGSVLAEALKQGWTPCLHETIPVVCFGAKQLEEYRTRRFVTIEDSSSSELTPHQRQLLEKYQVKASLALPLVLDTQVWGLLVVQQCNNTWQWRESEINFLYQVTTEFVLRFQQAEFLRQQQQQAERETVIAKVIDRIRQAPDIPTLFKTATQEVRQLLKADRVAVYRFNPDWGGEFVADSVARGWGSAMGKVINDTCLMETKGGRYRHNTSFAVPDIYKCGYASCHIELLEDLEAKAYMMAPVFKGEQLWGLLAAYQNSEVRQWEEVELNLLTQLGVQFGVALKQAELVTQAQFQAEQQKAISSVVDKIRQSLEIDSIFNTTTQEVRLLLKADRVAIYRFNPDWGGEFVADSVGRGWGSAMGKIINDTCLMETKGGRYRHNTSFAVPDIYQCGYAPCHIEILEDLEAKAYMMAPVFKGDQLWGLLAAYQNSEVRQWQEFELSLLTQVGVQFGVALQQAELLLQTQRQAERDRAVARIIERIRQSLDLNVIFRATTQEVRLLLKADRVSVYRFNPDWSGDFVAESVAPGWIKLVGTEAGTDIADTYLQETEGGRYRQNESLAVDDIYNAGHALCHIEILEQFEAKAYVLVPVFAGQKLWGLLAAYQNSGPRQWETTEVNLLTQIGVQLGTALVQVTSLEQLQSQSQQLAQSAEREKSAKELLQQRVIQLLMAVKPVFSGDLTVRVPLTEDEVGTIADAYNNTIQSLRKIVVQALDATVKVTETSHVSEAAIVQLSHQAQQQFQEVSEALEQIQAMAEATQAVAVNAQRVEAAVQQANEIVRAGDTAMNRTVDGILTIRETVAETSKKIKRLSESSQKISRVVGLIGNFTTQTQLLALNAAIEATRAGEYGRGFAVVADEVRSLSRQSAEATKEIEKLVQEIQTETIAVTTAMDLGIQQVVGGTTLVNETRQTLNAIVSATAQISELVQNITQTTQAQTQQSERVTQTMSDVAAIANKTLVDSSQIADSFQTLLATAATLQSSLGQFKVN